MVKDNPLRRALEELAEDGVIGSPTLTVFIRGSPTTFQRFNGGRALDVCRNGQASMLGTTYQSHRGIFHVFTDEQTYHHPKDGWQFNNSGRVILVEPGITENLCFLLNKGVEIYQQDVHSLGTEKLYFSAIAMGKKTEKTKDASHLLTTYTVFGLGNSLHARHRVIFGEHTLYHTTLNNVAGTVVEVCGEPSIERLRPHLTHTLSDTVFIVAGLPDKAKQLADLISEQAREQSIKAT